MVSGFDSLDAIEWVMRLFWVYVSAPSLFLSEDAVERYCCSMFYFCRWELHVAVSFSFWTYTIKSNFYILHKE